MKPIFALLVILLLLSGCHGDAAAQGTYDMTCSRIAYDATGNGHRCENAEAVCYKDDGGAMSCIPKTK